MNDKSEIQVRIEKVESDLAKLKADLAKCDCADGIEQERCWHAVYKESEGVADIQGKSKFDADNYTGETRAAYMPECRQVTVEDVRAVFRPGYGSKTHEEAALWFHRYGFRVKVQP